MLLPHAFPIRLSAVRLNGWPVSNATSFFLSSVTPYEDFIMRAFSRKLHTALHRRHIQSLTAYNTRPHLLLRTRDSPVMSGQFPFATSSGASSTGKHELDDQLLKMDIDAAEKHMKDWFGDHASWDHEKLLKLMYSK